MSTNNSPPCPYIVLAKYIPEKEDYEMIGRDLTDITKNAGLRPFVNKEIKRNKRPAWKDFALHAEVRKTAVKNSEATQAHRDGDSSTKDMDFAMVVWADHDPTEFIVDGKVFQPEPYELVLARNIACYHRRPNISGHRLFFRQRVEVPPHIKLP